MLSFEIRVLIFISSDHVRSTSFNLLNEIYFTERLKRFSTGYFRYTLQGLNESTQGGKHTLITFLSSIFEHCLH